jgi:hypothetical protein
VLQEAIKAVNFLTARLFEVLYEEMEADHKSLLLHSAVRWLSRGKVLKRLVELKEKVRKFLQDSGSQIYQQFLDKKWLALLSYLSDTFVKFNRRKDSLQSSIAATFQLSDKARDS